MRNTASMILLTTLVMGASPLSAAESLLVAPSQEIEPETSFEAPETVRRQAQAQDRVDQKNTLLTASSDPVQIAGLPDLGSGMDTVIAISGKSYSLQLTENFYDHGKISVVKLDGASLAVLESYVLDKITGDITVTKNGQTIVRKAGTSAHAYAKNTMVTLLGEGKQNISDPLLKRQVEFARQIVQSVGSETATNYNVIVKTPYVYQEVTRMGNTVRVISYGSFGHFQTYTINLKTQAIASTYKQYPTFVYDPVTDPARWDAERDTVVTFLNYMRTFMTVDSEIRQLDALIQTISQL